MTNIFYRYTVSFLLLFYYSYASAGLSGHYSPITLQNQTRIEFTYTGSTTSYTYSYYNVNGGISIDGNFGITNPFTFEKTVRGIDLSELEDGTIVLEIKKYGIVQVSAEIIKDTSPPTITIDPPSLSITNNLSVTYILNFEDALIMSLGGKIQLNKTGSADASIVILGSGTSTREVELNGITGNGTLGITINSGAASDRNGNRSIQSSPSQTFTVDNIAPSDHSAAITQSAINNANKNSIGFSFSAAEVGSTYNYTFSSSGGGTNVTGSGAISSATQSLTGLNLSGLNDGTITLSVTLTDPAGNVGSAVTDAKLKDVVNPMLSIGAPSASLTQGGSIAYTIAYLEANSVTLANANVTLNKTGSANGTVAVTGSGNSARTVSISSITGDGTLGITIAAASASDNAGNNAAASEASTTFTVDNTAPTDYSVGITQSVINNANKASIGFAFANAEVGATYNYTFTSTGGGTNLTGSGTISSATQAVTGKNLSGLGDGTVTLSVTLTDLAGNTGSAATNTKSKDVTAPSGYTVALNNSLIGIAGATATSFSISDGEIGSSFNYSIASSGDGNTATATVTGSGSGSGTINSASQNMTDVDVSTLTDGTITLTLTLTDVSGNAGTGTTSTSTLDQEKPVITSDQEFSIDENSDNNTSVGTVAATDNRNAFSNWTITAGNGLGIFEIDVSSGEITITDNTNLDREASASHVLTLTVSDGVNTSAAQTVTISVNDLNDILPIITAAQTFSIDENSDNGTSVGTVIATDADVTATTFSSWTITAGNDDGIFAINANTGAITIADKTSLDREAIASHVLTLTVSDGVNTSDTQTVTISINDLNDILPVITAALAFSIDENSENGTAVGTVLATDADVTATTFSSWTITGGYADGIFTIDENTGEISIADKTNLDFEAKSTHTLTLTVSDGLNTSTAQMVSIAINDLNDIFPVITNAQTFSIDENSSNGTAVGTVLATDADVTATTFSDWTITTGNNDGIFLIDPLTGTIKIANSFYLDFENNQKHYLNITVSDGTNTSPVNRVIITVIDAPDPPVISGLTEILMQEDITKTFTFSVQDVDTQSHNVSVSFNIEDETLFDPKDIKLIKTDESAKITLTPRANVFGSVNIEIIASDGELSNTIQVPITILPVNDAPNAIALSNLTIAEDVAVGFEVGFFSANDIDANETHQYTLVSGAGDKNIGDFAINGNKLVTDRFLDFEDGKERSIQVRCIDSGGLMVDSSFTITLIPNNNLELFFNTAFTPNGDGVNDTWVIDNITLHENAKVMILNAEGDVVFKSVGYQVSWDGTYKGRNLPFGTYYYAINLGNSREYKGFVMILK